MTAPLPSPSSTLPPRTAPIADVRHSPSWGRTDPEVTVAVAVYERPAYLPGLLAALAVQATTATVEVVLADDGSSDDTWPVLCDLVAGTPLPVAALRLAHSGGPSVPRNTAVAYGRGPLLAFTDDDCLPERRWLAELLAGSRDGAVVQGRTMPADDGRAGPWDRSITVERFSGLWESCNLAVPRPRFEAVGGFPVLGLLGEGGRGFGEDAVMGALAARQAGGRWAPDAVVRHRWIPGDYASHLASARRLAAFPELVDRLPELRERCFLGRFRNRRSAAFDLAVASALAAAVTRRPAALVGAAPWIRQVGAAARWRWGRPVAVRAAQEAATDVVVAGALLRGSVASRTLLL
jgi:glycosyltransferase involved in cell wall biosynthesis